MRIGISSFTFPWAIGGIDPERPITMSVFELLNKAHRMGADVLQIADNLPLDLLSVAQLQQLKNEADIFGVCLEVGTRGIKTVNIDRYLEIAEKLGSPILRVVIDTKDHEPNLDEIIGLLKPFESKFKSLRIKLAIENHDRLTCAEFNEIVDRLGEDWVGICLDTVNSLGAVEVPRTVIADLAPRAINVHMKDFEIIRSNSQMGFTVQGTALGEGLLDMADVISAVGGATREISAIIELWTPRQESYEETVALENRWAELSVKNLKSAIASA
ncbi:MAG: TIM barrel protein [Candidatus Planktophila sp.]|tara:strand:- start:7989 stop:8804 length:816 start_codon:yes stop_codon:yes gene_type:complete